MSPAGSQPRPEARPTHPEPGRTRGALSERERWALVHAAYPLNRGIPHVVDFPGDAR
jgi:hypothetical protein